MLHRLSIIYLSIDIYDILIFELEMSKCSDNPHILAVVFLVFYNIFHSLSQTFSVISHLNIIIIIIIINFFSYVRAKHLLY